MNNLKNKLELLPTLHSKIQLENFVLAKEAYTEFGLFKSATRELKRRVELLEDLELDIEEVELDIQEADNYSSSEERNKLNLRRLKLKLSRLEETQSSIQKEMEVIEETFTPLYESFKDADLEELEMDHWVTVYSELLKGHLKINNLSEMVNLVSGLNPTVKRLVISRVTSSLQQLKPEVRDTITGFLGS